MSDVSNHDFQDVETGEWGLVEQIETSARGHIPDDTHLLQRMEDEQVRQALERGCDRSAVIEVLDVSRRTMFNKHKRACAYGFPPDAVTQKRKGAPPASGHAGQPGAGAETTNEVEEQRRLDAVVEQKTDIAEQSAVEAATETAADINTDGTAVNGDAGDEQDEDGKEAALTELRRALSALQEVEQALSQA